MLFHQWISPTVNEQLDISLIDGTAKVNLFELKLGSNTKKDLKLPANKFIETASVCKPDRNGSLFCAAVKDRPDIML